MKSYTLKILILITSLTVIGCMPDSATKFKEDPPKKAPVVTSGGTVELPVDFNPTTPIFCPSGNSTVTNTLALVGPAAIPAVFAADARFLVSPFTLDGSTNPNYEFVVRGDGVDEITDLTGDEKVICILADDEATPLFYPYEEEHAFETAGLVWSSSPSLPTGMAFATTADEEGQILGVATGYNELQAYSISATNPITGTVATGQIEIASSTPLKLILDANTGNDDEDAFFYTQYSSASFTAVVADASSLLPNHYIVNQVGALALIEHIDYSNNKIQLTIKTPTADVSTSFFVEGDSIDQLNPDQVAAAARVFNASITTLDNFYAVFKTGSSIGGTGNDDFALHWDAASGFVSSTVADGLTAANGEEIDKWIRCSYTPSIAAFGIDFLNGEDATITQFTDIDNWGANISGRANYVLGALDRACEFNGTVTAPFNLTQVTTKVYTYSGEEATTSFKVQAADIHQPRPLTNTSEAEETNFFFHYQYQGTSASDTTNLIITVDDVTSFKYNSQTPDENKVSNGRGTSAVITYIDVTNKKLFVTIENKFSYAFVVGDRIDNSGTFLSSETTVADIEYTFELGKAAGSTTYFEPKIALVKAVMPIDIDATGLIITPFGANEFTSEFLKQINVNGSFSILGDDGSVQSRTISAVDLSANAHTVTVSSAFTNGIPSNVSQLAYVSPFENAYEASANQNVGFCDAGDVGAGCAGGNCRTLTTKALCEADGNYTGSATGIRWISEKGNISYSIDNYSGVSTSTCGTRCDTNDQVLAGTTGTPQIVFKPGSKITDDNHGRIAIVNDLNTLLSSQEFIITATGYSGNQTSTNFKFSVSAPPANLSMNRNLLLNVPSGSAFQIGSYISSNNADAGTGIIKDIITAVENGYDYLDIQIIKGKFSEFDDLDNRPNFSSQQTYVLGGGVIKYNAAVELASIADAQEFDDELKCTTNKRYNRFIDGENTDFDDDAANAGTAARGTIAYQWDSFSGDTSQLRPTANNRVYLQVERGEINTTDTINAANCSNAGAFDQGANAISEIIADNMYIEYAADADFITGLNITSDDGANRGAGVIHSTTATNTRAYIGQYYHAADGIFLTTQNIDNINPYVGPEQAITNTGLDHTFYLYRYEEASIEFDLRIGLDANGAVPSDTIIEFLEQDGGGYCTPGSVVTTCAVGNADCSSHTTRTQCESDTNFTLTFPEGTIGGVKWVPTEAAIVPTGLTFDTTNGRIFGTPDVNADKQKYTIRVTNPYGSVEHDFSLKVYDKYEVTLTNTAQDPKPDSYSIHQIGFGMASVPCRVTQEAIDTATAGHVNASDVIDLTCVLDAGESDLHTFGLKLTINSGDGICSTVDHYPTSFFTYPYVQTASQVVINSGDYTEPLCGAQPQNLRTGTSVVAGTYISNAAPPATAQDFTFDGYAEFGDLCKSSAVGSDYTDLNAAFPNCDDGQVNHPTQLYTLSPFLCEDGGGTATADNTPQDCRDNNGSCDNSDPLNCDSSCAADCSTCTTEIACETGGTNSWVFAGAHNDASFAVPGALAPLRECVVSAVTASAVEPTACGGSPGSCMAGASKDIFTDEQTFQKFYQVHSTVGNTPVDIVYASPSSEGHATNLKLANYSNENLCITSDYAFDWTNFIRSGADTPNGAANPFAGGRNYYEYSCNGGAGTIARIRMLVRDFDNTYKVTDLIERLDLPNADNVMDDPTGGTEFCSFPGCNNRSDWDNFSPTSSSCGNADLDFDFTQPDLSVENFPREAL